MRARLRTAARLAVCLSPCAAALAWQAPSTGPVELIPRARPVSVEAAVLRVDSSLVLIPVHVTTASGASVTNLVRENFTLFDNGVPQTITHFSQGDAPVSIGLLVDVSGSMKNKMQKVSEAAADFLKASNPEDEFFLVKFNEQARLTVPFTQDWTRIYSEIARSKPFGLTSLLDAVQLAMRQMKQARNTRRAVVILSDGGENFSSRNLRQLKNLLLECGAQVYAIGLFDSGYFQKHTVEERNGPKLLDELAMETGGHHYPAAGLDSLDEIATRMARELRTQYILGYSPAGLEFDGKFRPVQVKLALPGAATDLRTYYKQGYYAQGR